MPYSGNFAVVYKVEMPTTGQVFAVKCFTREVTDLRQRYHAIAAALKAAGIPVFVRFHYLEHGICIKGNWFPVLKMQWLDGVRLNEFVGRSISNLSILLGLADLWIKLAQRLVDSGIAHGDLQHGNALLYERKSGTLSLRL